MTPGDSYHFESMFTDFNPKEDKIQICASVSFVEIEERKGKNKRLQNMFSESIRRVHLL